MRNFTSTTRLNVAMRQIFGALMVVSLWACGGGGDSSSGDTAQTPEESHAASITQVDIEVDYVAGAEPYTGSTTRIDDIWSLSQLNIERLFPSKSVTLPHTLADMEEITGVVGEDFDSDAILAIADNHRDTLPSDTLASFYIVWLNGYFDSDGERQTNVLGVTLGNTGVLAMFKPVIAGTSELSGIAKFVEQTTLIHEMGHAAGLVDNGITPVSAHKDDAHGAHCTNEDCVMYYLNEGVSDIVTYANKYAASGSRVLFDDACLADVDSVSN